MATLPALQAFMLQQRCAIQRGTVDELPHGETVLRGFQTIATDVPCSIRRGQGTLEQLDAGTRRSGTFRAFFLPGVDVQEQDRVAADGRLYEVTFVHAVGVVAGTAHHLEADLVIERGARPTIAGSGALEGILGVLEGAGSAT
jgi:hypothetical protein